MHSTGPMPLKRFYIQLSALVLSIFMTMTPFLASASCEPHLTGPAPASTSEYSEKQDVFFGARRMLQAEERAQAMAEIGAPSAEEIEHILFVSRLQAKYNGRLAIQVRQVIEYLQTRRDWNGYQKAVFWDSMAVEIDRQMRALKTAIFSNFYHEATDGSFMFQGEVGETVVFTKDGRIFKGRIESIAMRATWQADYSGLRELP